MNIREVLKAVVMNLFSTWTKILRHSYEHTIINFIFYIKKPFS